MTEESEMEATTLYLANGVSRVVKGKADEVGIALKARTMSVDDGLRQFVTVDGDAITVAKGAVVLVEAARVQTKAAFGFARELAA